MKDIFEEGKVYEVLLVTKSNVTPIGVVRKGNKFHFKLFGGKSFQEIKNSPFAVLHVIQDVELLIKAALNMELNIEFEDAKTVPIKRIKGMPATIEGKVEWKEEQWKDELGETKVLSCVLTPTYQEMSLIPIKPLSRADYALLEMGVLLTRLFVATRKNKVDLARKIYSKIWENYQLYKHLGGKSELAEKIIGLSVISVRWNT
jgi:hypothetical protein